MRISKQIWSMADFVGHWVHPLARSDTNTARHHATYIAVHLLAGTVSLMAMPVVLSFSGTISPLGLTIFICLLCPLLLALYVSKTGQLDRGINASLAASAGFIAWLGLTLGGVGSFVLLWFCVLPIESAMFGGLKALRSGIFAALGGFAFVAVGSLLPEIIGTSNSNGNWSGAHQISVLAALLYTAILAFRIDGRHTRSQSRLQTEKTKFRLLSDNSLDLITQHRPDGSTLFASPASLHMFDCDPVDLEANGYFNKIHLHDRVMFLRTLSAAAAGSPNEACEFRISVTGHQGSQEYRWVELRCKPVLGSDNDETTLVAVTRDITAAKIYQEELQTARTDAEKSNKAKTHFLANMSHELRTPLNAIIGFSDLLQMADELAISDKSKNEYASLIHDAGQHLLKVVNDILDISKIEAGKYELNLEACDLGSIMESTVAMLTPQIQTGRLVVSTKIPKDLADTFVDHRALRQIMINLLSNAVKFTPEGGRINIELETIAGHALISVTDNGIGISADDLQLLGKPFSQVSNQYDRANEGTGLGLSMTKGLVELHNGVFKLESNLGEGTTARVKIPLKFASAKPVPTSPEENLVWLNAGSISTASNQITASPPKVERKNHAQALR